VFEKKEHQNSGTLGKDTINNWIIPFLSVGKRGSYYYNHNYQYNPTLWKSFIYVGVCSTYPAIAGFPT